MTPNYQDNHVSIYNGDCRDVLKEMPESSINCCITSPPYFGLRDYGVDNQIGLEDTPDSFVSELVSVFRDVKRVLRDDGTLWLNLGDSYGGAAGNNQSGMSKIGGGQKTEDGAAVFSGKKGAIGTRSKDLIGIPWRVAFALQADGWYLRQDIIWHKPSPMPESVTDRCTKAHEYIFLLSKSKQYYYDHEAIMEESVTPMDSKSKSGFGSEKGKCKTIEYSHSNKTGKKWEKSEMRNRRSVWTVAAKPYKEAHFATFPAELITPCILAGCPEGGTTLDPFGGSGTTAQVSKEHGRKSISIELNPSYIELQKSRVAQQMMF